MSEILAPAGDKNAAIAAIYAGADAVYLGLDSFSARASAENFGLPALKDICLFAHAFGVKVYVAMNTLIKDSELDGFFNALKGAYLVGADAIILQDAYLGAFIKERIPDLRLHLSTQGGTCNAQGAELAKKLGFSRVILARETAIADVREIAEIIETECFIQGALCTCFSGQCYLSSFVGGNSGNRGACKQPCRKIYSYDRKGFTDGAYRLSLSDLSVGESVSELIAAGVTSFKIEGRMRRPEYVAAAVKYYKNLLSGNPQAGDLSDLKRTYNRGGYTRGLAFGQDKNFISSAVQGHIGEFVGVIKVENGSYVLPSSERFTSGDRFKILRGGKELCGATFGGVKGGKPILNSRVRLKSGDKAFITTDESLDGELLSVRRAVPVSVDISLSAGGRAEATVGGVKVFGDTVSAAQTRPLTEDDVKKCFCKVGDYPFEPIFGKITLNNAFLPQSSLNALRRNAYAEYLKSLTAGRSEPSADFTAPTVTAAKNGKIAVIAADLCGLSADVGVLKPDDYGADLVPLLRGFRGEKFLYIPPYLSGEEIKRILRQAQFFDGVYADGYFGAELAEELGLPLFAGTGFNITNAVALRGVKAKYAALSKELTIAEAAPLAAENVFYLAAGDLKVMDLIYCPFSKSCKDCDGRRVYTLTDEEGRRFPVRRYVTSDCRFEVYNCNKLSTAFKGGALIDCTLSDPAKTVAAYKSGGLDGLFGNFTRGHSVNKVN